MEKDEELERIRKKKQNFPTTPITVTDAALEELIQKYPLVVIDCWAPWCGPCLMVAPVIEELARDYAGKIIFGKLNVDENQRTAVKYNIMSIPTMLIFKNGKLVDQTIGAMPKQMLEPMLTKYL